MSINSIPASAIVQVNPGVIGTGGSPLSLNGLILDQSTMIPTGRVLSFVSSDAVAAYFGISSTQAALSEKYFLGNDNSTIKPGTLFVAPFAGAARAAWLRSGTGLTLAAVKAAGSGTLILTINGTEYTTGSIALSGVASLSAAATAIQTKIVDAGATGTTVVWDTTALAFVIQSSTTGAGSTISFATGTHATALKFTQATSALLSQGVAADTADTAMANVKANVTNWGAFTTTFEPDTDGKTALADWSLAQNQRYLYIAWDSDENAVVADASTTFGAIVKAAEYDGVTCISGDSAYCLEQGTTLADAALNVAMFALGTIASIDFSRTNARITTAFESQAGMDVTVADQQKAENLLANGYNFYGRYAAANDQFLFLYDGQMAGKWKYIDPFVNQIYMNSQFQLSLMTLLTSMNSIPYNQYGYSLIRAALADPIAAAKNFGGIRSGVILSALQIAQVNAAAGLDISKILFTEGEYLQVLDPGAQVRGNRGTPVINFWYTDGGSVHKISFASIDIL